MVSYTEVRTEILTEWGIASAPKIYDKDLRYDITYPNVLFLKMYKAMPIKPISQSNNEGLTVRRQIFKITGVYTTYAAAKTAVEEIKRIITEYNGWYVGGEADIIQTDLRHVLTLPCYERAYLQKGEW